jgi:hypothetical protein
VSIKDKTKKVREFQYVDMKFLMPGSFALLPTAKLRSGTIAPDTWAQYSDWVDSGGNLTSKYASWAAKTFDRRMFKVKTTGDVWAGSGSDILDLDFRFRSGDYSCAYTGGAMYHLMYPKKDKAGLFHKLAGDGVYNQMGPCGEGGEGWSFCWGYSKKQPATRICVSRLIWLSVIDRTFTREYMQGHVPDVNVAAAFAGVSVADFYAKSGSLPYNSLSMKNTSCRLEIYGSNSFDGNTEPTGWIGPLAEMDTSEWLKYDGATSRGISEYGNKNSGTNEGTAIWFPFDAALVSNNPAGWQYYKIIAVWGNTGTIWARLDHAGNPFHSYLYNSTRFSPYTFVLGGAPETPLDLGNSGY